jgi:hypothetical protein
LDIFSLTYLSLSLLNTADVDCTAEGKPLCTENGVRGYPTIKWGDPNDLEQYKGGRDFDTLKKFAEENLKPICSPFNMDVCDDSAKAEIKKYQDMSEAELDAAVKEKDDALVKAEKDYQELEKSLKSQRGVLKAVKAFKKSSGAAKEEL